MTNTKHTPTYWEFKAERDKLKHTNKELLEALQLASYEMKCVDNKEHDEGFKNALSKIASAIAKAGGK